MEEIINSQALVRVHGYDYYYCDASGNIYTCYPCRRNSSHTIKILKPCNRAGYLAVKLYKNKISKLVSVHKIIYTSFKDDYDSKFVIDHIDGNKTNNDIGNLRLVTNRVNCSTQNKRRNNATGESNITLVSKKRKYCNYTKYMVTIWADGRQRTLGHYQTIDEAIKVRDKFKERMNY